MFDEQVVDAIVKVKLGNCIQFIKHFWVSLVSFLDV
jgi:hypothetical protein